MHVQLVGGDAVGLPEFELNSVTCHSLRDAEDMLDQLEQSGCQHMWLTTGADSKFVVYYEPLHTY